MKRIMNKKILSFIFAAIVIIVLIIVFFAIWKMVVFHRAESVVRQHIKNKYDIEIDVMSVRYSWLVEPIGYRVHCVTSNERLDFDVKLKSDLTIHDGMSQDGKYYISADDLCDRFFQKKLNEYIQNNFPNCFDDDTDISAVIYSNYPQDLTISQSVIEMNKLISDYSISVYLRHYSHSNKEKYAKSIVDFINALKKSELTPSSIIIKWEDKNTILKSDAELSYGEVIDELSNF